MPHCRVVLLSLAVVLLGQPQSLKAEVSFSQEVRPILSDHCFACHGPDGETRQADLRLDSLTEATERGVLVPGDADASEVWLRITSDDPDLMMPPPEYHKPLTAQQRQTLRKWIQDGAQYETHWSFSPPQRPSIPELPAGERGETNTHPIDAFLQKSIREAGLTPAPPADRQTLIRRATLDLTGLPPTPSEIDEFVHDSSADAYEKLIQRLFSRVTYGEHMARYWLDLARYADTHGLHLDNERSMWPYRDWVVQAFNQNLPFDEFTRWQLAGDLLESPTREQKIASGFNRCNVTTSEGGSINEEWIFRYAVDRTTTTAEVWMGLTAGCAVCHDHKFDPLSAKEYYSLYAFFHSAADPAMDGNQVDTPPIVKLHSPEQTQQINHLQQRLAKVKQAIEAKFTDLDYLDPATLTPRPDPVRSETAWFEDAFPAGAQVKSSGAPIRWVDQQSGQVYSGQVALERTAQGVAQDYYNAGAKPLTLPAGGMLFVHCYLEPDDAPEAIMIQIHTNSWEHRAIWGEASKIPFGTINTPSKRRLGELPALGRWVKLEIDPKVLGLKPNDQVTGFAFTQFGGTVTWDYLGVESTVDRAADPTWSWQVWRETFSGKNNAQLPTDLRNLVRGKRWEEWSAVEHELLLKHWQRHFFAGASDLLGDLATEQEAIEREIEQHEKGVPVTMVMADLPQMRESHVMLRGQYDNPGEAVTRGVPSFLPPLPPKDNNQPYDRLDLANWLVSGEHPLTSRVAVNRIWQQLFGVGLVPTSGDFGSQGDPPTHPELLDYLAIEFAQTGWDIQRLLRLIMTSHAYRQSSLVTPQHLEIDPSNRLLSRAPRLRLDAEVLRDQTLFISGLMVNEIGGQPVKPYQPPNIWEPVGFGNSNTRNYRQDHGDALYRRSLYTFLKRTAPPPFMSTFDAPNREQACSMRQRSNTPLQALQLMNDIQHVEAARHFALRIVREGGEVSQQRIRWAWRTVTGREPTSSELSVADEMLQAFEKRYLTDPAAAQQLITYGESETPPAIPPVQLASYTMLANLLFNLDETINKN